MEVVTTKYRLHAVKHACPLVCVYAYTAAADDTSSLKQVLQDMQVLAGAGVLFVEMDMLANDDTRELKRLFAVARFPSVLVFTHGEVREIVVGDDCPRLLASIAKWHKTVYAEPK